VKLDELILELQHLRDRHGNIEVIDAEGNDDFSMEVQGRELILCEHA
jgi:hypothetical protein